MKRLALTVKLQQKRLLLDLEGEFSVYTVSYFQKQIANFDLSDITQITFRCEKLDYIDSAAALALEQYLQQLQTEGISFLFEGTTQPFEDTLKMVRQKFPKQKQLHLQSQQSFLDAIGKKVVAWYEELIRFITFLGEMMSVLFRSIVSWKHIRYKEILFEMNESAIKAVGIIALTSFLVGLVVAYQSAYQLKIYGANIFIVDMLGLSILRELAPMLTAIVIAGRSGSAYTAQIGAMKITQEIDAMKTMGFDPFAFLVLPRMIALMVTMPLLIFLADMAGMFGGVLVASIELDISYDTFVMRFSEVIAAKHFFVGVIKGPFFAFLIASIAIYRGLRVKDDTQSIGFNTTKSVVESIFMVIVCDALFSIAFTNLGI